MHKLILKELIFQDNELKKVTGEIIMSISKTKRIRILETELKAAQNEFKTTFDSLEYMLENMRDRLFSVYIEGVVFTLNSRPKFEKAQREFSEVLISFNKLWTEATTRVWNNVTALQDRLQNERKREE